MTIDKYWIHRHERNKRQRSREQELKDKLQPLIGSRVKLDSAYFKDIINGEVVRLPGTDKIRVKSDMVPTHMGKQVDYVNRYHKVERIKDITVVEPGTPAAEDRWLILYLRDPLTPDRPTNESTAQHYALCMDGEHKGYDVALQADHGRSESINVARILKTLYTPSEVTRDAKRQGENKRRRYLGTRQERANRLTFKYGHKTVSEVYDYGEETLQDIHAAIGDLDELNAALEGESNEAE